MTISPRAQPHHRSVSTPPPAQGGFGRVQDCCRQFSTGSVEWMSPPWELVQHWVLTGSSQVLSMESKDCDSLSSPTPLNPSFSPLSLPCLVSGRGTPSSASKQLYLFVLKLSWDLNLCICSSIGWGKERNRKGPWGTGTELEEIKVLPYLYAYIPPKTWKG